MKKKGFDPARSGKNIKGVKPSFFLVVFLVFSVFANVIFETIFRSAPTDLDRLMPTGEDLAIFHDSIGQSIDMPPNTYPEENYAHIPSLDLPPEVETLSPHFGEITISVAPSLKLNEITNINTEFSQSVSSRTSNLYFSNKWMKDNLPKVDFGRGQFADSVIIHSSIASLTSASRKVVSFPFFINRNQSSNLQLPISKSARGDREIFFSLANGFEFSELSPNLNSAGSMSEAPSNTLNESGIVALRNSKEAISPRTKSQDRGKVEITAGKSEKEDLETQHEIINASKALDENNNEENNKKYTVIGVFVVGSESWTLIENDAGQIKKYSIGERIGDYYIAEISDGKVRLANSLGEDIFANAGNMF